MTFLFKKVVPHHRKNTNPNQSYFEDKGLSKRWPVVNPDYVTNFVCWPINSFLMPIMEPPKLLAFIFDVVFKWAIE